jgi:hypothetical protein
VAYFLTDVDTRFRQRNTSAAFAFLSSRSRLGLPVPAQIRAVAPTAGKETARLQRLPNAREIGEGGTEVQPGKVRSILCVLALPEDRIELAGNARERDRGRMRECVEQLLRVLGRLLLGPPGGGIAKLPVGRLPTRLMGGEIGLERTVSTSSTVATMPLLYGRKCCGSLRIVRRRPALTLLRPRTPRKARTFSSSRRVPKRSCASASNDAGRAAR